MLNTEQIFGTWGYTPQNYRVNSDSEPVFQLPKTPRVDGSGWHILLALYADPTAHPDGTGIIHSAVYDAVKARGKIIKPDTLSQMLTLLRTRQLVIWTEYNKGKPLWKLTDSGLTMAQELLQTPKCKNPNPQSYEAHTSRAPGWRPTPGSSCYRIMLTMNAMEEGHPSAGGISHAQAQDGAHVTRCTSHRAMHTLKKAGFVTKTGTARKLRWMLTDRGLEVAEQLVRETQ